MARGRHCWTSSWYGINGDLNNNYLLLSTNRPQTNNGKVSAVNHFDYFRWRVDNINTVPAYSVCTHLKKKKNSSRFWKYFIYTIDYISFSFCISTYIFNYKYFIQILQNMWISKMFYNMVTWNMTIEIIFYKY